MSTQLTPRALGHVAISVPDAVVAADWYREVLGFTPLLPVALIDVADGGTAAWQVRAVYGPDCRRLRVAHLVGANGAALELFEFLDPAYEAPDETFAYWRGGLFHLAVIDPDVPAAVDRIVAAGGRARSEIVELFPGQPYFACYCEDPYGTIVEITSHSHAQMFANQGGG